ncbi:hypothetical protein D3C76_1876920 [compost metagenome]
MQLLSDKPDGHQTRMVMALGHNQDIVFNIFIDDIPRIFATLFGTADPQPFTLA